MKITVKSLLVNGARVLLAVALGCGVVEFALRTRDGGAFPHLNVYEPDAVYGLKLQPLAATRVAFGGSAVTDVAIHSGGFRAEGSKPAPEPVPRTNEVLFVGDSQTFGLGVQASEAFAARFAALAKRPVYNAGVPTWGPPEFTKAVETLGARRRPHTVVYVVNFANDPFEANRPNRERHAEWDGWAVRREHAPVSVVSFPGRDWLFRRSHAVYALRQAWHELGPQQNDERGTPSEGTFRDLHDGGLAARTQRERDRAETARLAELYETEATYAEESYRRAETHVRALVWKALELNVDDGYASSGSPAGIYLAADANPGDIVQPGYGEEGRPLHATAEYIRKGVEFRNEFEAKLRKQAEAALESESAKKALSALSARDAERLRVEVVRSKPLEIVRSASPLTRAVLEAKAKAEGLGAKFVLLVLPLDVMVSPSEWTKHGSRRVDLTPARVLVEDLVESVRAAGAVAIDATDALAKAQPGAFLPGDIHLTPKGHEAVARALAEGIHAKAPPPVRLSLPAGRSRVPPPETWTALAGQVAVIGSARCPITKKYREWLYISCYPRNKFAPKGTGIEVVRGEIADSIATVVDGRMVLVAPIPKKEKLEALFSWADGTTQRLLVDWDAAGAAPSMRMVPEPPPATARPSRTDVMDKLCVCHKNVTRANDCHALIAAPDPDCFSAYPDDCAKALACAEGNALYSPRCAPGFVNSGATLRCVPAPSTQPSAGAQATPVDVRPQAQLTAAERAKLETLGKDVVVRAQAFVGDKCLLKADSVELIAIIPFDRCPIDENMVSAYHTALAAFDAIAGKAELDGPAATYASKAALFGSWVRLTLRSGETRGTAALYQDLAIAFNAWQPSNKVFVDSPRMVKLFIGTAGVAKTDYFRNLHGDGAKREAEFLASGRHLVWRRGPNGFEGPYGSLDERIVGGYDDP